MDVVDRSTGFPVGASVTLDDLTGYVHPHLARLRANEPVSWLPSLVGPRLKADMPAGPGPRMEATTSADQKPA